MHHYLLLFTEWNSAILYGNKIEFKGKKNAYILFRGKKPQKSSLTSQTTHLHINIVGFVAFGHVIRVRLFPY